MGPIHPGCWTWAMCWGIVGLLMAVRKGMKVLLFRFWKRIARVRTAMCSSSVPNSWKEKLLKKQLPSPRDRCTRNFLPCCSKYDCREIRGVDTVSCWEPAAAAEHWDWDNMGGSCGSLVGEVDDGVVEHSRAGEDWGEGSCGRVGLYDDEGGSWESVCCEGGSWEGGGWEAGCSVCCGREIVYSFWAVLVVVSYLLILIKCAFSLYTPLLLTARSSKLPHVLAIWTLGTIW